MGDLTRNGLNNQKRMVCVVGVNAITEAEILAGGIVANLPKRVMVTGVKSVVTTASTTVGAQVTLKVGATAIATNVAVATAGVKATATPGYFVTGGTITISGGTTPPAAGNLVAEFYIEYIELDRVTGEYVG